MIFGRGSYTGAISALDIYRGGNIKSISLLLLISMSLSSSARFRRTAAAKCVAKTIFQLVTEPILDDTPDRQAGEAKKRGRPSWRNLIRYTKVFLKGAKRTTAAGWAGEL